jgi:hypothetical protein
MKNKHFLTFAGTTLSAFLSISLSGYLFNFNSVTDDNSDSNNRINCSQINIPYGVGIEWYYQIENMDVFGKSSDYTYKYQRTIRIDKIETHTDTISLWRLL